MIDVEELLAALSPEDVALVSHLETCVHMHVTTPEHHDAWKARRDKARLALLRRLASPVAGARDT